MKYFQTKQELVTFFTENYYSSINYTDYTSRIDKYRNTAEELYNFFCLEDNTSILDYGCAVGLLLDGFYNKGLTELTGFDISEWAVNNKVNKELNISTDINVLSKTYQYTFALDVFEHMFNEDLTEVLSILNTDYLIVRIPVKLLGQSDYHLEVSRRDMSHVNCKTKGEWIDYIESYGFKFTSTLELQHIYDSAGCFCGIFKK